ncbi:MAG: hypothetical protein ACUVQ3_05400 [bacterium]
MIDFRRDSTSKRRRIIPPRKHYKPMRFVGFGLIMMLVIIWLLFKLMIK